MTRRLLLTAVLALLLSALLLPFSVAAATNADIIAILREVVDGVIRAGRDAYCASGVVQLCPK